MSENEAAPKMLTNQQFEEMAGLLEQLKGSRNARVRRNSIMAWVELIRQTDDVDLQKNAIDVIIDTAVTQDGGSDDDVKARRIAAEQLTSLDPELVSHARRKLSEELSQNHGPERARRAAELALAVTARSTIQGVGHRWHSLFLTLRSFALLEKLVVQQWFLTLRDGLIYLIVCSLLASLLVGGVLKFLAADQLQPFYTTSIEAPLAAALFIFLLASIIAVFSIPARLASQSTRLLDALWIMIISGAALYLLSILLGSSLEPADFSNGLPAFLVTIGTTRLILQALSGVSGLWRIATAAGAFAGGETVGYLLFAFVLREETAAMWAWAALFSAATVIGSSWSDQYRSATRISISPGPRDKMIRRLGWAAAAAGLLAVIATGVQYRHRLNVIKDAITQELLHPAGGAPAMTVPDCARGTVEPIRNIRLDQYYTVRTCPGRSLEISVTPPPPVTGTDGRPVRFPEFGPEFLYQDVERLSPDKDTLDYVRRMRYGGELSLIGDGGELHVCVRNCLQVSHSLSVLAVTRLFGLTWRWSAFEQEFRRRNDDDGPQIMVAEDASDARTQWSADSPARYPDARYTITIALGPPQ